MKLEEKSPMSRRSSTMFNMHSESCALQELQRVRATNRRFSFIAGAAIFLLALTLISLVIFDLYHNSLTSSNHNKTSQSRHFEHLGDLISAQQWKVVKDVEIEPIKQEQNLTIINENKEMQYFAEDGNNSNSHIVESLENKDVSVDSSSDHLWDMSQIYGKQNKWYLDESSNTKWYLQPTVDNSENNRWDLAEKEDNSPSKRWDFSDLEGSYANHRYDNNVNQIQKNIAWRPRPFTFANVVENSSINSADTDENEGGPPAGFSHPVRFRGVYVEPKSTEEQPAGEIDNEERNEKYYNKINSYFSRRPINAQDSSNEIEDTSEQIAEGTSDSYTKAIFPEQELTTPKSWNRKKTKPTRKPFTVMLDIYPMGKDEEQDNIKHQHIPSTRPKGTIYYPIRPGQEYIEPQSSGVRYIPQVMLPPKQRRKGGRMLMKLNLFPKSGKRPEQKRRTWGMFSRQEDDYYDDVEDIDDGVIDDVENGQGETSSCNGVIGHNPFGKPITAKWKDKHGDLIHAKYVALKQYKNRMDQFIDPR